MPNVTNTKKYPHTLPDGTQLLPGQTKNIDITHPKALAWLASGEVTQNDSVAFVAAATVANVFTLEAVPDDTKGSNGDYWWKPTTKAMYKKVSGTYVLQ